METNELSVNATGGTELMLNRLYAGIDPELLSKFQIIPSRVRELTDKKRILYCHDLVDDPETEHLNNGGWKKFNKIVFVSHFQKNSYIQKYKIPYEICIVIENAIEPFNITQSQLKNKFNNVDPIKIIYTPTPHRGLVILLQAFDQLSRIYPIELDVYSSFVLYGWKERDAQFEGLFEYMNNHERINNFGTKSNQDIRDALQHTHIFAHPSIWPETSCISIIEALCAGNVCIHSSLAALPETTCGKTIMYQEETLTQKHLIVFSNSLEKTIQKILNKDYNLVNNVISNVDFFNRKYNINVFLEKWKELLITL